MNDDSKALMIRHRQLDIESFQLNIETRKKEAKFTFMIEQIIQTNTIDLQ